MLKCGLLGEKLGHSYSPQIHSLLGDYEYRLYEKPPERVADFLKNGDWDALNVTIPYKKTAASVCDELFGAAAELGSVNTLVKKNGRLIGYNTDYFGFVKMADALIKQGVKLSGRKALVLGSGGASVTVCAALKSLGALPVVISRSGENNYSNLSLHGDAGIIVNATPVGMYPNNGGRLIDLSMFKGCTAVMDLIYNPLRTPLIMQAQDLGIASVNGLSMLVAQAKMSSELFCGTHIADGEIDRIEKILTDRLSNIILIGMPGCGKSSVAASLAKKLERPVIDIDKEIEKAAGLTIPEIFERRGEAGFRKLESQALSDAAKLSGRIIATGGGCVTVKENYPVLHQNGTIVWIKRDTGLLPTDGRPISMSTPLSELYVKRKPMYESFADAEVDSAGNPDATADRIIKLLGIQI